MRLRHKASRAFSVACKIARDWNRELKEHGVSPFFGWLLTGAFSLYLIVVFTAHAILWKEGGGILPPTFTMPVWIVLVALVVAAICIYGKPFVERLMDGGESTVPAWKVGVGVFLLFFAWLVVLQAWPASSDTIEQMRQVHDFRFNDWHPILHTFSLCLITRIHDSLFAVTTVQVIAFSALVAWLYRTLRRMTSGRASLLVTLFLALNLVNFAMLRSISKDIAFALASLSVSISVLNIIASRGDWLKRSGNVGLLALLLFLATFYRHNGIFFTASLCLGLAFSRMSRAARLRLFAVFAVFAALGVSYWSVKQSDWLVSRGVIDIQYDKEQRFAESVGLPMSGMLGAYVNVYDRMPDDARNFISHFGGREKIFEAYRGDYNSVKFKAMQNTGKVAEKIVAENSTPKSLLEMFVRTARATPKAVVRTILHVTSLVWDPMRASPPTGVPESSLKRDFCWPINVLMATPIGCVFGSVGFWMMVLVGVATVGFVYRGRTAWLLSVPWLCYGFGTMCLLCGDDWRFFYALVLCAPLAIAVLFMKNSANPPLGDAAWRNTRPMP